MPTSSRRTGRSTSYSQKQLDFSAQKCVICEYTTLPTCQMEPNGKGGNSSDVIVLAGYEQDILDMIEGRDPNERLFAHIPKNMDMQGYRRDSAQARYQQLAPGRELPPVEAERIKPADYDKAAVQEVSEALGPVGEEDQLF